MAEVFLSCDAVNLLIDNKNSPICEDSLGNNAWISIDAASVMPTFSPITIQEGAQITGAIALVWTIGWIGRQIQRTIQKTRYG